MEAVAEPSSDVDPAGLEWDNLIAGLRGKTLFLLPYTHADYAWRHPRYWHEMRYLAVFDKVMRLAEANPAYRFFFDSLSESVIPCLAARPEMLMDLRRAVGSGQLEFCGGQWSNVRPNQVGDETFIRNMTVGRTELQRMLPDAAPTVYANLDVAIGHSQIPQLMSLGGFQSYFAWRPETGLDSQGVPRSFVWKGLSGDKIHVTRHYYGGWSHPHDFMDSYRVEDYHLNPSIDLESTVRRTWKKSLRKAAFENRRTISFCQGGDDAIPNGDLFYGFDWGIDDLMAQWNAAQDFGCIRYGTPAEVFSALREEDLPQISGPLDQCDVGYNIACNGANGIWRLRDIAERELTQAETMASLASLSGYEYPEKELLDCWKKHLTFCTHAVETLFEEDFCVARLTLQTAISTATAISRHAASHLVDHTDQNQAKRFCIFNPLPEARTEFVAMTIPNTMHCCSQPLVLDSSGRCLPMQIVKVGPFQRYFEVISEIPLRSGCLTEIKVDWAEKAEARTESVAVDEMNITVRSDLLEVEFRSGHLVRVENLLTGQTVLSSTGGVALMEPVSLPQQSESWMTTALSDEPLPFQPETLTLECSGPLLTKIRREGTSGPHQMSQVFSLYRGRSEIEVETTANIIPDCTNICLRMPLDEEASLNTDIPFGVESRAVAKISYGRTPTTSLEDDGENIERLLPGVFWGRSWVFSAGKINTFGLITLDGSRYYRDHGRPRQLLNFLACIRPNMMEGDFKKTNFQRACGKNVYRHILTLGEPDFNAAGMVAKSQRSRTNLPVFSGTLKRSCHALEIHPEPVRISAFYRQGKSFFLRAANTASRSVEAHLKLPAVFAHAEAVNFHGMPVKKHIEIDAFEIRVHFEPWEIVTLKLPLPEATGNNTLT